LDNKWFTANRMTLTFILLGSVIFLFIIMPLARMIVASDGKILLDSLLDSEVRGAIWLSLYAALIATMVGLVLGVPPHRNTPHGGWYRPALCFWTPVYGRQGFSFHGDRFC